MNATAAWLALAAGIVGYVVAFDEWAIRTRHQTMSGQFHAWLQSEWGGPVLFGLLVAIPVGLGWHFITYHHGAGH